LNDKVDNEEERISKQVKRDDIVCDRGDIAFNKISAKVYIS